MEKSKLLYCIDKFLSSNEERDDMRCFLLKLIMEIPNLYYTLFDIIRDQFTTKYQKHFTLIMIKTLVENNFIVINSNFEDFSNNLYSIKDIALKISIYSLTDIIIQVARQKNDIWEGFKNYILLFFNNPAYLHFSLILYFESFQYKKIVEIYDKFFIEYDQKMILNGLNHAETIIISIKHIVSLFENDENDELYRNYEEIFNKVYEIAQQPMNENDLNIFWSLFYDMKPKYIGDLLPIAFAILNNVQNSNNSQMILLRIIINCLEINPDYLEFAINKYFQLQSTLKMNEFDIFEIASKVDFNQSYELFRNRIIEYVKNADEEIQYILILMLSEFIERYSEKIYSDISTFIELLKQSIDSFKCFEMLSIFISNFLEYNELNAPDIMKVFDILINCFQSRDINYQFLAYQVCQEIGPNQFFFDYFIERFTEIKYDSYPIYFSTLINLHSVENNMINQKYENFFNFIIENFEKSFGIVEESANQYKISKDQHSLSIFYNNVLLQNSFSNLIFLFCIFYPSKFENYIGRSFECFTSMIMNSKLEELDRNDCFSLTNIKKDFILIFKINKLKSSEILNIKENNKLIEYLDAELLHILVEYEGADFLINTSILSDFGDFIETSLEEEDIYEFNGVAKDTLLPMSKWLFKIENNELYENFFNCFKCLMNSTKKSSKLFFFLSKACKNIVKLERTQFIEVNESYKNLCGCLNEYIMYFSENLLPNIGQINNKNQTFKALINLLLFLQYSQNPYSRIFFGKYVMDFYNKSDKLPDVELIKLLIKIIDHMDEESVKEIIKLIDAILSKENVYLDPRPDLFILLTKISKKYTDIFEKYFEGIVKTFINCKVDQIFLDLKVACSFFLLASFNQDQAKFNCVAELIPDILSVFPCKKIINEFFIEIHIFYEKNKNSSDVSSVVLSALIRYLSYSKSASIIFKFNEENKLLQMVKELIKMCDKISSDLESLLSQFFSGPPT